MTNVLTKAYWTLADIQEYLGCGRTTASKLKVQATKLNGGCAYSAYLVKRDAVLRALGLDPEKELMLVGNILSGNENND